MPLPSWLSPCSVPAVSAARLPAVVHLLRHIGRKGRNEGRERERAGGKWLYIRLRILSYRTSPIIYYANQHCKCLELLFPNGLNSDTLFKLTVSRDKCPRECHSVNASWHGVRSSPPSRLGFSAILIETSPSTSTTSLQTETPPPPSAGPPPAVLLNGF